MGLIFQQSGIIVFSLTLTGHRSVTCSIISTRALGFVVELAAFIHLLLVVIVREHSFTLTHDPWQLTFEVTVPAWVVFFYKWNHLVSDDVFSTTFTLQRRSFPPKTPVLTKSKSRNGEPDIVLLVDVVPCRNLLLRVHQ